MTIPLSLYIHIPWCESKCPYCDFNSHVVRSPIDQTAYIDALISDLQNDINLYKVLDNNRQISSIFIGGGTPSLFEVESIALLLEKIKQRLPLSTDIEVTLEANPGSSEINKFIGFSQAGVTRLSIGVQSFDDTSLQKISRTHNADKARKAVIAAQTAGFKSVNLDLMFGLPQQRINQALTDLSQAIELKPAHLSLYQLTLEPNTLFHAQPPALPDDNQLWQMQSSLHAKIKENGYEQYEVSAFATETHQCQHNLNYWQYGDYLAIGAGAHGKWTDLNGHIQRYWKIKHPLSYMKNIMHGIDPAGNRQQVKSHDIPFEFMLNALRLSGGFSLNLFEQRSGLTARHIQPQLTKHQQQRLLIITGNHIQPTELGQRFANQMMQDYLTDTL